jgi:hypothetical protein
MTGWRVLVGGLALTGVGTAPALAHWGWEPAGATRLSVEHSTLSLHDERSDPSTAERGPAAWSSVGRRLGLGLDVGPLHVMDPGATVSLDLRVGWPPAGGAEPEDGRGLQPYLTVGPALFIAEPADAESLLGPQSDPTLTLGFKAGAGVSWRLDRGALLFGEYRLTRGSAGPLSPFGIQSDDAGGYDLLYGVRFRF